MIGSLRRGVGSLALGAVVVLIGCSGGGPSGSRQQSSAPIALLSGPSTGAPGATINFVATGSTDPQGQSLTYAWNFGDGTTATGVAVQHTFALAGTYTVTLTVTDTSGLSATASQQAHIALPPVANPGGPYSGYVGVPLLFNGSASTDPQGYALTYFWKFGDNATGTGVSPTHTYTSTNTIGSTPGTFTVTLIATNSAGISSTPVTTNVNIALPPPVITINGPYIGRPTLPVSFTSSVTEPYDGDYTYLWNFGDGSTSNVADPNHTYATAGTYTITLSVTGQYDESATVTSTADIITETSGSALTGVVESGTVPVSGAHVYLFAANTTGYGQASVSLLSGTGLSDTTGTYVLSDASGVFSLPAGFSCPAHSQLYLYATGGTVGTNSNADSTLLSALGSCGYLGSSNIITVNEATTVAAAYAISGYALDPTHVSSPNTTSALTGISNAFLNAASLTSITTGKSIASTPDADGNSPQTKVNTLASILNACITASASSGACTSLFQDAMSSGNTGTAPSDTATAAINIAHNQGANASTLYALQPANPAFTPALTAAPHDWAMGVSYSGIFGYGTSGLAVDAAGNVWVLQYPRDYISYPYLTELSSNGVVQQDEDTTCLAGTESIPNAIAIDPTGNVWLLTTSGASYEDVNDDEQSYYTAQYCTVSNAGVMLSPPGGYGLGGSETSSVSLYNLAIDGNGNGYFPSSTLIERSLNATTGNGSGYILGNSPYGAAVAIDGNGNAWVSSPSTNGIVKLSSTGNLLSPANGYTGGGLSNPGSVAIDNTGNVWAINTEVGYINAGDSLSKISSTGAPLSGSGFTNTQMLDPYALAIDGSGNVWVASGYDATQTLDNSVIELAPSGALSMYIAHPNSPREYLDDPQSIAVDSSGSVWVSNGLAYTVTQFIGASTPVVTPLAANLTAPYNAPASKP